jgi:short-subunit dehydrogenase
MIAQGDPCHVVTIASGAAVTVYPGFAAYSATKHAALAATEALRLDLEAEGVRNVGVTIVMPGMIRTAIMEPEKASPASLELDRGARLENRTVRAAERMMSANLPTAMAPEDLARQVFDAVAEGRLYALPNHDDAGNQALIQAIARGRATGADPFPPVLDRILASMARADG